MEVEVIEEIKFIGTKHDNGCVIGFPSCLNRRLDLKLVTTLSQATSSLVSFSFIVYLILFNKMNCSWILIDSYDQLDNTFTDDIINIAFCFLYKTNRFHVTMLLQSFFNP